MSDATDQLLEQAAQARRDKRLFDAHQPLVEAIALCRQDGNCRQLVQAIKALGQIERDQGHGDVALPLYEEATAICRGIGDPNLLAHTVRHLGDIHLDAGRLTQAKPCYLEALAIYRSNGPTPALELANAIRPLAILREAKGEIAAAATLWKEAMGNYESAGVQAGVAECLRRLRQHDG